MSKNELDPHKPTILIANDNDFILVQLRRLFRRKFNVITAENGFEALMAVKERPKTFFDAILLDVQMPMLDGFEACSQIVSFLIGDNLAAVVSVGGTALSKCELHPQRSDLVGPQLPPMFVFTGDMSPSVLRRIEQSNFLKGFDAMRQQQVNEILQEVKARKLMQEQVIRDDDIQDDNQDDIQDEEN